MTEPTFTSILDRPMGEIEKPKPIPPGTYLVVNRTMPEEKKSSQKQTPFYQFTFHILQAGEDVDLSEFGEVVGKSVRADYYLTDDAAWRLKKLLAEDMGIEAKTISQAIPQTINRQVLISVKHEMRQRTLPSGEVELTGPFARVTDTAPAE